VLWSAPFGAWASMPAINACSGLAYCMSLFSMARSVCARIHASPSFTPSLLHCQHSFRYQQDMRHVSDISWPALKLSAQLHLCVRAGALQSILRHAVAHSVHCMVCMACVRQYGATLLALSDYLRTTLLRFWHRCCRLHPCMTHEHVGVHVCMLGVSKCTTCSAC
jgi:hypothetical protein